jgi:hypothetical protein
VSDDDPVVLKAEPEDDEEEPLDEGEPLARDQVAAPVDEQDPEEHFIADDDATPGATPDETRGPAD